MPDQPIEITEAGLDLLQGDFSRCARMRNQFVGLQKRRVAAQ